MTRPIENYHFIISCARSGSTWLTDALNNHPVIFASEHRLFGDFCELWPNNNGTTSPRITFDAYAKALSVPFIFEQLNLDKQRFQETFQTEYHLFLAGFIRRHSLKTTIIDKVTPYRETANLVVDGIKAFFPNAKLIRLIRDGRDVLTSGTFDWLLKDGIGSDRYRWLVDNDVDAIDRFFDDEVIERWATEWTQSVIATSAFEGPSIEVRYENMKADLTGELRRVFEFLDVDNDANLAFKCARQSSFEKKTGRPTGEQDPTAKTRKGIVGDWQNYFTRHDGELYQSLAGELLMELGYAECERWYESLPEKILTPSTHT